ncbi:MAG: hypothetical protein HZB61_06530 [Nitrospirae bacterium]|nr:hypothetical protein [Nitrospirota bacterium]
MKTVKYEIKLKGLATPDGTISVKALLDLMGSLTDCAERGLLLDAHVIKNKENPAKKYSRRRRRHSLTWSFLAKSC